MDTESLTGGVKTVMTKKKKKIISQITTGVVTLHASMSKEYLLWFPSFPVERKRDIALQFFSENNNKTYLYKCIDIYK